jgi:serine/threonine protein kinase
VLRLQVEVMKRLEHENIVALREVLNDNGNELYMVQEFMELGPIMTAAEYNKPLDPEVVRSYFR